MIACDEAPVEETGASLEDSGEDSTIDGSPVQEPGGGPAEEETKLAFKHCSDLVLQIQRTHGDLSDAFSLQSRNALAKTFRFDPKYQDTFRTRVYKAGADHAAIESLMASVRRIQSGRGVRLISAEGIIAMPPPKFLIDGLIEDHAETVLYGASGTGKTFVALDWAASVASGIQWLGHAVRQGTVIYVAAEGTGGLNKRLAAWKMARGVDTLESLYFVPDAVSLLDAQMVTEVIEEAEHLRPILIVFDTHARCMAGGDENSAQDTGLVIQQLDRTRVETGAGTLTVHHTGKNRTSERGSGALRGAVDTMIELKTKGTGGLSLVCEKQRNFEPFSSLDIRMVPIGDSVVPALGNGDSSASPDQGSPIRAKLMEVLSQAASEGRSSLSQNDVVNAAGVNRQRGAIALAEMAADPGSPVERKNRGNGYSYSLGAACSAGASSLFSRAACSQR